VRDLSPTAFVPRSYFSLDVERRLDKEVGIAVTLRVARQALLYAEERRLLVRGSQWDPKQRVNIGIRWQM